MIYKPFRVISLVGLIFVTALLLLSCGRESTAPEEAKDTPEYHLVYGPARETPFYVMKYSTKTGALVDSNLYGDNYYEDFRFIDGGNKVVCVGWPWSDPGQGRIWIADSPTGEVYFQRETDRAKKIYVDPTERYVLTLLGPRTEIYTLPELGLVYGDSISAMGGGFLPGSRRAFYFREEVDSLFLIDFTDPYAVSVDALPVRSGDSVLWPKAAGVDCVSEKLVLLAAYDFYNVYIQVMDTDSLSRTQELAVNRYYNNMSIHPGCGRVYLHYANPYMDTTNRIDIYGMNSNTLSPFIGPGDISIDESFMPKQLEFTPDGEIVYVLMRGGIYGYSSVVGIRLSDKEAIHYFKPEQARAEVIRVNPRDFSQE
jgi:hypothetical protein